jgi:hypothetical protein
MDRAYAYGGVCAYVLSGGTVVASARGPAVVSAAEPCTWSVRVEAVCLCVAGSTVAGTAADAAAGTRAFVAETETLVAFDTTAITGTAAEGGTADLEGSTGVAAAAEAAATPLSVDVPLFAAFAVLVVALSAARAVALARAFVLAAAGGAVALAATVLVGDAPAEALPFASAFESPTARTPIGLALVIAAAATDTAAAGESFVGRADGGGGAGSGVLGLVFATLMTGGAPAAFC